MSVRPFVADTAPDGVCRCDYEGTYFGHELHRTYRCATCQAGQGPDWEPIGHIATESDPWVDWSRVTVTDGAGQVIRAEYVLLQHLPPPPDPYGYPITDDSRPDTSQPYFLDLIRRIDQAVEEG